MLSRLSVPSLAQTLLKQCFQFVDLTSSFFIPSRKPRRCNLKQQALVLPTISSVLFALLVFFIPLILDGQNLKKGDAIILDADGSEPSALLQQNEIYRLRNQCSNKMLDVSGASQQDGAPVVQWTESTESSQQWQLRVARQSGYYMLIAQHSNQALSIPASSFNNRIPVQQQSALMKAANQQWKIIDVGGGYYKLRPRLAPDKVLDVKGSSTQDGTPLRLWTDNGSCAQRWKLERFSSTVPRLVFAHYMVALRDYGGSVEGYKRDIREAQAAGLDGFALNVPSWNASNYKIDTQHIFEAAQELHTNFKLFFSLDMCCGLPPNEIQDMVRTYASHPNYYHYQNRPMVSTYGGEGQNGGGVNARNWWQNYVLQPLRSEGSNIYFVPAFSPQDYNYSQYEHLLENYNLWWKDVADGMFLFGAAGIPDYRSDNFSLLRSGENYARLMHENNRPYMATVSPQYWGALQDGIGRRYFEFQGGEGLEAQWRSILDTQKPEWIEMVTWNDFTESTYFSPIYDVHDYWPYNGIDAKGFFKSHAGALELNKYFIGWYKSGARPAITKDQLYWFYRTHPKDLIASNDPHPQVSWRIGDVQDEIYVTTLLTEPAELRVTTGGIIKVYSVPAGMEHTRIPFNTGTQVFELWRSGARLVQKSGDPIDSSIVLYNFNYTTGFAIAPPR